MSRHGHRPSAAERLFSSGGAVFGGGSKTSSTPTTRPSTSGGSPNGESAHLASAFSRKASLSSTSRPPKPHRSRNQSVGGALSPEKHKYSTPHTDNHPLPVTTARPDLEHQPDSFGQVASVAGASPHARTESYSSTTAFSNMLVRPSTAYQGTGPPPGNLAPMPPTSPTLENITYQHIQETSSKRISTLDYLRKAHEGRVYWFNTLLFNKPDLQRMPYFDSRKLARRATNYLLLGLSLPTILDLNSANPTEFLKTLNALLVEFESFQQVHPPDGSSSLSRARFPQMFKRAATGVSKGRRTSSAAEIGLPMGNDSSDPKSVNGSGSGGGNGSTAFSVAETDLLPGEEYALLLTPSLPFDPDFYETFATLCDVLIDCYTKLMSLVTGPRECSPAVAELFTKADARVRKVLVQGIVKEFEDSSRAGVKSEVAGVSRVVLGGLM